MRTRWCEMLVVVVASVLLAVAPALAADGKSGGLLFQAWGLLLGVAGVVWGFVVRNRRQLLVVVLEGIAFAEKVAGKEWTNQELEDEAVRYVARYFPQFPEVAVRLAIRKACLLRKRRVVVVGVFGWGLGAAGMEGMEE